MKRFFFCCLLAVTGAGLLLEPACSAQAARDGLALCARVVVPSLFPFFVLSSLVIALGGADVCAGLLGRLMRPLFGVGGAGGSALALGLVGGYPVGARTVRELCERGDLPKAQCERLLSFCNNAGPGFILGVCGGAVFRSARAGVYLYLVHVAAAVLTGMLLCRTLPRSSDTIHRRRTTAQAAFASVFPAAVQGAAASMVNICAFVVLFMVLLRLLASVLPAVVTASPFYPVLLGFLELTNGVTALPPTRGGFMLCALFLGWGGLSVHCQTLSALSDSGLSTRYYWRGKCLQAVISALLAYFVSFQLF